MDKAEIVFLKQKDYKFIKRLGRGGFGETILITDETIGEDFVCKKYSPIYKEDKEDYYKNFVQEIKLLHLLNHKNIVRVFNYYLYPEKHTGYILMEYINGTTIDIYLQINPDRIKDIFLQTIYAFQHLEELKILHRDIRPQNILVTEDGRPKIIDFGFGKQMEFSEEGFDNSISLNWRYVPPSEFTNKIYDFRTEIYFIGKLFEEIINDNQISTFSYTPILRKMIFNNYNERFSSFLEISREISTNSFIEIQFNHDDKRVYLGFADNLILILNGIHQNCQYNTDLENILQRLEILYNNSILEEYLQNPSLLIGCFLKGGYRYFNKKEFPVYILRDFIIFFRSMPKEKQKIILNNIWQRLDAIVRIKITEDDNDLPF